MPCCFSLSFNTWILWCCRCFCRSARLCLFLPSEFSHFSLSYLHTTFIFSVCRSRFVAICLSLWVSQQFTTMVVCFSCASVVFFFGGCTQQKYHCNPVKKRDFMCVPSTFAGAANNKLDRSCQTLPNHCDDTLISLVLHDAPQFSYTSLAAEQVRNGRWPTTLFVHFLLLDMRPLFRSLFTSMTKTDKTSAFDFVHTVLTRSVETFQS